MSFKDRFAITKIRDKERHNLSVSIDEGIEDETGDISAVFLFTPSMKDTIQHHHIELNREEATTLRDWLNEFLSEDICLQEKYINDRFRNAKRRQK